MASATLPTEALYESFLGFGQVKHALKTALACCLATLISYYWHVSSGEFAPVFAFLIMTLGMPSPRLNWVLTLLAIGISACASAVILVLFHDALFLFLAATLLWIFFCLLFSNWYPLPATLGAMVSALGIFVFLQGRLGDGLSFYLAYWLNWLIGGASVVAINTLLWPFATRKVFVERLAEVYAYLEGGCRQAARRVRSHAPEPAAEAGQEWAPFRRLRQQLAPELHRGGGTSNPFAAMILACRSLALRLRFFDRAIAPATPVLPAQARDQLASLLLDCADHLRVLLENTLLWKPVQPLNENLLARARMLETVARGQDTLLSHGIHNILLYRLVQDLQLLTAAHGRLFTGFHKGLAGELVTVGLAVTGKPLIDEQSVRSGAKLVIILILLLLEEGWLSLPGGSQVAFFATFFASTGNLGRQNKTNLVGLFGLFAGLVYGILAAFLTSHMPHFPLLLALVLLGEFLASLAYQKLPRFGAAGLQGGLAIPFAYLATTGPEWGSFTSVRTRFAGLVVAGFTAVVVHAYLWPVLPMRQLRASIAAGLRATAASLRQLLGPERSAWEGAPASLEDAVTRARDLLDDARYLPGPDHADPAYTGILACLQEIDANLEYIHLLVGLEPEHALRQQFFQVIGDYAEQARTNLQTVALQFQQSLARAARIKPVQFQPNLELRWENARRHIGPTGASGIDPLRPAVIARCLDQVAWAVQRISEIIGDINLRALGSERREL